MEVRDIGAQRRRIYHVLNGAKGSPVAEAYEGISANAWTHMKMEMLRRGAQNVSYTFPDGFPAGKVGFVTSVQGAIFNTFQAHEDALNADIMGRWSKNSYFVSVATTPFFNRSRAAAGGGERSEAAAGRQANVSARRRPLRDGLSPCDPRIPRLQRLRARLHPLARASNTRL